MEISIGLLIVAAIVAAGVVFILRRQPAEAVAPVVAKPSGFTVHRPRNYRFTTEPVTGLGQLAAPRWTTRRRHVGVVCAMRDGYCRVALVNRPGYEPKRVSYRIGSLRRVATN